jgi:serine/threonine protein kinase
VLPFDDEEDKEIAR